MSIAVELVKAWKTELRDLESIAIGYAMAQELLSLDAEITKLQNIIQKTNEQKPYGYVPNIYTYAEENNLRMVGCFADNDPTRLKPVYTAPALTHANEQSEQQFCFCNEDISLQLVSGGDTKCGLYEEVTLLIGDTYVTYGKQK